MLNQITSVTNKKIVEYSKLANKKYRQETGLFCVEGEKAYEDIVNSNIKIEQIFVTENYENISRLQENITTIVSESIMKKLSTSDTPPKIFTIAHQNIINFDDMINGSHRILLLDGISDAGNMGTLIRLAVGFNFDLIILANNCVDVYNPKVLRASTGNFFKIDFAILKNNNDLKKLNNHQFIMTDLYAKSSFSPEEINLKKDFVLVFGSEANGISKEILNFSHDNLKIKTKNVESLNVATAGAIIMYELAKKF